MAYVHVGDGVSEVGTAVVTGSAAIDTTYTTLGLRASGHL
jgi:hypothetical protein